MGILIKFFKYIIFSTAVSLATCVIALFLGIFFLLNRQMPNGPEVGAPLPHGSISDIAASQPDPHALPPPEPQSGWAAQDAKYQRAIEQLKLIEGIEENALNTIPRNICDILCKEPVFKVGHLDFVSFYNAQGSRSFEDPDFRLQLESLLLLKQLFPPQTIQLVSNIKSYDAQAKSIPDKLTAALVIEAQVLKELFWMGRRVLPLRTQGKKLEVLRNLRKQCAEKPLDDIKVACRAENY